MNNPHIALKKMSCYVDDERKQIVFLYKMVDGVSEKSYGMNIAALAGVDEKLVKRAEFIANEMETQMEKRIKLTSSKVNVFKNLNKRGKLSPEEVRSIWKSLQKLSSQNEKWGTRKWVWIIKKDYWSDFFLSFPFILSRWIAFSGFQIVKLTVDSKTKKLENIGDQSLDKTKIFQDPFFCFWNLNKKICFELWGKSKQAKERL